MPDTATASTRGMAATILKSGLNSGMLKPGLLLCSVVAVALLVHAQPPLRALMDKGGLLRDGWRGWIIFLCAGTLIGMVGLPRQAVGFAGGFVYGPLVGTALATGANLIAALADLLWARWLARDWVARRLLPGRAAGLERFVATNPFTAILTLRLLPVGSSLLVSLLAGVLPVPVTPFLAATLFGSLPQTVIFVLVGSGTRIAQPVQIALALGLFLASGLVATMLLRRHQAVIASLKRIRLTKKTGA